MILFYRTLGSVLFFCFFLVWMFILAIIGLPFLIAPQAWAVRWIKLWGHGVLIALRWLCGIRYQLDGIKNLPPKPFILAVKHQSTFETIALYTLIDDLVVVLKRELLWIPFYGWYVAKVKMIPINRDKGVHSLRQMLDRAKQASDARRTLMIFPEGTRTKPRDKPQYKSGIAAIYQHAGVPVVPVSLNSGLFWSKRQFFKNSGCIRIVFHAAIAPGLSKQEFMSKLENVIESGCESLYSHTHGSTTH